MRIFLPRHNGKKIPAFAGMTLGIILLTALGAQAARAAEPDVFDPAAYLHPYVGVDVLRYDTSYGNYNDGVVAFDYEDVLEDQLNGFGIHVGNRFNRNFGLELGYFRTREEDKDLSGLLGPGTESTVQLQGATLDALGYLPVSPDGRFELIGTAGVSYTKAEVELDTGALGLGTLEDDESEIGFRIGGGAEYFLTDDVNVRAIARYQSADFDGVADNTWVYSAGLNFSF